MSIIESVSEADATGWTAGIYAEDRKALGYVPSHTKVLSVHPEALAAAGNYLSRVLQALAVEVDVPPGLSAALRDALLEPLADNDSTAAGSAGQS